MLYHLWNVHDNVIIASSNNWPALLNAIVRLIDKGFGSFTDYNIYKEGEKPNK